MTADHLGRVIAGLPSLQGSAPPFDPSTAPDTPGVLFQDWFEAALRAGIAEPHAMTLSTIGDGTPDARILVLKDFDPDGRWAFASSAESSKGRQLAVTPSAALTFYWPTLVRSIRIRGTVAEDSPAANAANFLDRSVDARAIAISGQQSVPLDDAGRLETDFDDALRRITARPDLVPGFWRKYWVQAAIVEFWQGEATRRHARLRYERSGGAWTRSLLRP